MSSVGRESKVQTERHPAITGSAALIARSRTNPRFSTLLDSDDYKRLKIQVPLNDTLTNCLGVSRQISLRMAADEWIAAGRSFGRSRRNGSPFIRLSAFLGVRPMNVTIGTSQARPSRRREALGGALAT